MTVGRFRFEAWDLSYFIWWEMYLWDSQGFIFSIITKYSQQQPFFSTIYQLFFRINDSELPKGKQLLPPLLDPDGYKLVVLLPGWSYCQGDVCRSSLGGLHTSHLHARTRLEQSHKGNPIGEESANPGFILRAHPCLLDWGALPHKVGRGTWSKYSYDDDVITGDGTVS